MKGFRCQTCGREFDHWRPYVTFETILGKRIRRLITNNDARSHEAATGHRVTKVIGPRI